MTNHGLKNPQKQKNRPEFLKEPKSMKCFEEREKEEKGKHEDR